MDSSVFCSPEIHTGSHTVTNDYVHFLPSVIKLRYMLMCRQRQNVAFMTVPPIPSTMHLFRCTTTSTHYWSAWEVSLSSAQRLWQPSEHVSRRLGVDWISTNRQHKLSSKLVLCCDPNADLQRVLLSMRLVCLLPALFAFFQKLSKLSAQLNSECSALGNLVSRDFYDHSFTLL